MKVKDESEKVRLKLNSQKMKNMASGPITSWEIDGEKVGLKLNIQKTKNMASGPTTSWQIDGETVETVSDFFFFWLQNHCRW